MADEQQRSLVKHSSLRGEIFAIGVWLEAAKGLSICMLQQTVSWDAIVCGLVVFDSPWEEESAPEVGASHWDFWT